MIDQGKIDILSGLMILYLNSQSKRLGIHQSFRWVELTKRIVYRDDKELLPVSHTRVLGSRYVSNVIRPLTILERI